MDSDDEWVDVNIDKSRLANYKGTETYDLLLRAGFVRLRTVNVSLTLINVAINPRYALICLLCHVCSVMFAFCPPVMVISTRHS